MRALVLPRRINIPLCILVLGIIGLSFTEVRTSIAPFAAAQTDTVTVCGSSTTLTANTINNFSNPIWNTGASGPTLTVNSSGDYWWQVTGTSVVVNGDFSASTASSTTRGFTSAYTYKSSSSTCSGCCCGLLSVEGTYTINTNPNNVHTNFKSMGDHTTGSGKMLIVNGASTANTTVWTQDIVVLPNTDYVFSAWATSVNPQNPAQLTFSINGSPLGTINPTSTTGDWQYFTTIWNSGTNSGTMPIALVNQNIATSGNDFAVDDIVFAPVYRKNIHVVLNPIPVLTLTGPHAACVVYDLTKTIVNYNPTTYSYVFKDSHGNVLSLANAQAINQSGTYTITETNKTTGCTSAPVQTTVTINPNPQKPGITSL